MTRTKGIAKTAKARPPQSISDPVEIYRAYAEARFRENDITISDEESELHCARGDDLLEQLADARPRAGKEATSAKLKLYAARNEGATEMADTLYHSAMFDLSRVVARERATA